MGGLNSGCTGLGSWDAGGAHAAFTAFSFPPLSSNSGVSGEQRFGKKQLGPPAHSCTSLSLRLKGRDPAALLSGAQLEQERRDRSHQEIPDRPEKPSVIARSPGDCGERSQGS